MHALELGFRTILINDASRGIDMGAIDNIKQAVKDNHGLVVDCQEVKALVQGRDRRIELGYQLALQCRKSIVYPPKNKNSRHNKVPGMEKLEGAPGITKTPSKSTAVSIIIRSNVNLSLTCPVSFSLTLIKPYDRLMHPILAPALAHGS